MSKKAWFVVVPAEEPGAAEMQGPLEVNGVLDFEESGLSLNWLDDGDDPELVVVDIHGEEIDASNPDGWKIHPHFQRQQTVVEDTERERWLIIIADSQDEAETVQDEQESLSVMQLGGPDYVLSGEEEEDEE